MTKTPEEPEDGELSDEEAVLDALRRVVNDPRVIRRPSAPTRRPREPRWRIRDDIRARYAEEEATHNTPGADSPEPNPTTTGEPTEPGPQAEDPTANGEEPKQ